jgi:SAM-dependent methyltransferase
MTAEYDLARAAAYWGEARHENAGELAAVLSLGEPAHVNAAYDAWETGLLGDALGETPGTVPAARGLDLGAGVGRLATRLAPRVVRLACGDLAEGMLERLRRNAAAAGIENIDPLRLRSDRLPFRDGAFAVAVCLGLLEHLPPDVRRRTILELARVVRPGGLLALALNNDASVLLRDPADNPHRVGAQRANGYFCAVVGREEILAEADAAFEDRALGSNLFYSLQRHASRALDPAARRDPRLGRFFERAAAWDRTLRPLGPMASAAADHHLHLLVRR